MMNDPQSWYDAGELQRRRLISKRSKLGTRRAWAPRSATSVGTAALSGYRFGVISGLNVMLHRTGKRHDPEWERIALSVPYLFGRARDLLKGAR